MKKITNAFAKNNPEYGCFACSPNNKHGLHLEFFKDGEFIWSEWNPRSEFDGWKGVTHGGIQATIIDETAEWFIFSMQHRSAVTMELNVKYRQPLVSDQGIIKTKASLICLRRNIAEIKIEVFNPNDKLCTEATGKFYVFSEEDSKVKYNFPNPEEFE